MSLDAAADLLHEHDALARGRIPTHRCKVCKAFWILWPDTAEDEGSWSLFSRECGACCDNAPMGEQIEPLPNLQPDLRQQLADLTAERDRLREALDRWESPDNLDSWNRLLDIGEPEHGNKPLQVAAAIALMKTESERTRETLSQLEDEKSRKVWDTHNDGFDAGVEHATRQPDAADVKLAVIGVSFGILSLPLPDLFKRLGAFYLEAYSRGCAAAENPQTHDAPHCPTCCCGEFRSIEDVIAEHERDPAKKAALDRARSRQPSREPAVSPLCSDCPPVGYPTDSTRCEVCPRRGTSEPKP